MEPIRKFLPIIVGAVAVIVVGAGMFIAGRAMAPKPEVAPDVEHKVEQKKETKKKGEAHLPVYVLRDRVVNLADPGARRYLKVSLGFEFDEVPKEVEEAAKGGGHGEADPKKYSDTVDKVLGPYLNHEITQILSAKTAQELATPDGKEKLLTEIKQRINDRVGPRGVKVADVLLTDFVIQ